MRRRLARRRASTQLVHARWCGKDHDGDACFLIDIPAADVLLIPPHNGGPIATLDVVADGVPLGAPSNSGSTNGRLQALDYSTFEEIEVRELPDVRQLSDA